MNKQQIFDKAASHLAKQKKVCTDGTTCVYQDSEGNRCIVGALFSNETMRKVKAKFKDLDAPIDWLADEDVLPKYLKDNIDFLMELQDVHDYGSDVSEGIELLKKWRSELGKVAKQHGLKFDKKEFKEKWNGNT